MISSAISLSRKFSVGTIVNLFIISITPATPDANSSTLDFFQYASTAPSRVTIPPATPISMSVESILLI